MLRALPSSSFSVCSIHPIEATDQAWGIEVSAGADQRDVSSAADFGVGDAASGSAH
jgi:hypothetical protein